MPLPLPQAAHDTPVSSVPPSGSATGALSSALAQAPAPETPVTRLEHRPPSGHHRTALKAARAFCEALFSTKEGPPPTERMDWLMGELDDYLTVAGWRSGGLYKVGLLLLALLAPLMILRPLPLWRLTLEQRVRALRRMEHSPLAVLVLGMKSIICIIYYEHPEAAREIGYTTCEQRPRTVHP